MIQPHTPHPELIIILNRWDILRTIVTCLNCLKSQVSPKYLTNIAAGQISLCKCPNKAHFLIASVIPPLLEKINKCHIILWERHLRGETREQLWGSFLVYPRLDLDGGLINRAGTSLPRSWKFPTDENKCTCTCKHSNRLNIDREAKMGLIEYP